jgi:hypothetical protein
MNSELFRKTLVEINFVAFGQDRHRTEFLYDVTIEQASEYVWKICPTAVILYAWEYCLEAPKRLPINKKKLTDEELAKFNKQF